MRGTPLDPFLADGYAGGNSIWLLTRTDEPSVTPPPAAQSQPAERDLTIAIETAPAAQAIGASYLGRELIPLAQTSGTLSGTIRLPAGSAADLLVTARWTGTGTAALRVEPPTKTAPG